MSQAPPSENGPTESPGSQRPRIPERRLVDHMEILVTEAEKRANGTLNIREHFTVYLVETKLLNGSSWPGARELSSMWRRYSQFEMLKAYLEHTYSFVICPALPEKKSIYSWNKTTNSSDTFDPDFVDRRRAGLETFLNRVAAHPVLSKDDIFLRFLQSNDGWQDKFREHAGYIQFAESKLKSLSLPVKPVKCPDKRFETHHKYGADLHSNIMGVLKVRTKMLDKQHSLHKLHANYGRVFSEWSALEREMGDGLQRVGHYMDSFASCVDARLEEEELIADQLKEYLFLADSLQFVCRKQQTMQLNLDRAIDQVEAKNSEKQRIQQGKSGLMSRLFGAVDSEEVREAKLGEIDYKINQNCSSVKIAQDDLNEFTTKSLDEIEKFHTQKNLDVKETLASLAILQVKASKKFGRVDKYARLLVSHSIKYLISANTNIQAAALSGPKGCSNF